MNVTSSLNVSQVLAAPCPSAAGCAPGVRSSIVALGVPCTVSTVGCPGSDITRTSAGDTGPDGGSAARTTAATANPVARPNRRARPTVMGALVYQFAPNL